MNRSLAVLGWLYAAILAGSLQVQAEGRTSFDIAAGAAGSDSFVFATELWAVSEIALMPNHGFGLETVERRSSKDRLRGLDDGEVEFALVRGDVPTSFARRLRAVMTLWPNGIVKAGVEPTQLLVHGNVPEDVVYQLLRAIFEHAEKLIGARATIGIGSLNEVTAGLSLSLHPGAYRYYRELEPSFDRGPGLTSPRPHLPPDHGVPDYATLENDEILQLKAACRDALEREALEHFDGHYVAKACDAHSFSTARVNSIDISDGQGGPKLSAGDDEKIIQPTDAMRRNRSLKALELQPTM